ncbi:hypothetical protein CAEBREN_12203 [Caenorhabditis brenneri]|uniref:Amino acid transporter transmembrane domain-containing protein n=1 Tax=Caenorhabditis brenneri TaxID=135651 RepID=G0PLZ8_CAEBE|nr:hypothetical protein CAEBREN_28127 [Caenorhabditis brenneri]EGT55646.1 hypothetical protein CAEBREN_12203 [Caenorhabditis brenneri]
MNAEQSKSLLSSGHLSADPYINNCYSEMCMSTTQVAPQPGKHKIGWVIAAIFIIADMVGGGVVAMPVAFKLSGLPMGIIIMLTVAVSFEYTGYLLGKVWNKIMERNPHIGVCRKPFPEMAKRTMGTNMQRFTSVLGNVTQFGVSVVYLLLSSNIIHYFLSHVLHIDSVSNCLVITALAFLIWPFTLLASPGEFWVVIVFAMLTTVIAVVSIHTGIALDSSACFSAVSYPQTSSTSTVLSFGIFLFAFSGHYVFPTIQHDMKNPRDFTKSIIAGFFGVVVLYLPLCVFAFVVYGDSMAESVIYSIQSPSLQLLANLMISFHCIMTLVIVINPLNQEVEHYAKISHAFGIGRVITRTIVLFLVLFVALTVPDFQPVMNLVGASTIPMGCAVLPSLFYLYSEAATEEEWRKGKIPTLKEVLERTDKTVLIINLIIIFGAILGGLLGSYQGVLKLIKAKFTEPCYIRLFTETTYNSTFQVKNVCCGANRDINVFNVTDFC